MEVMQSPNNRTSPFQRKGCNPVMATQRSKMQSQRSQINQQLYKQTRIRNGAENLLNATTNSKVKETVALELSFVNSNLQLLKEELSDINSTVEPYQNKSGKATSIPMLPLGLKDTNHMELMEVFETFIAEHYGEDPRDYSDEIADLVDMRTAVRTPSRSYDGIALLLKYYNQLYFIENRFFGPNQALKVFFHWYDCITGEPSIERSVSLEKASILFNVGALYSQIATRADRSRKKELESAIDAYQRSAGVFKYLMANYSSAPTQDLSASFLNALSELMLAQAQECNLEHRILGGFEIELGKCAAIAQEAMKVSEKYGIAEKSLVIESLKNYVPFPWVSMVRVKVHHFQALSHYYAGLGLIEQHEAAEPDKIANLLSTLYLDGEVVDVPKPDDAAKRKEDRLRLGKSHLRHAVYCHELALQTHSLCKIHRSVDILKEYLHHAHQRSVAKFAEIDSDQDFFDLIDTPSIQAHTDTIAVSIPPAFKSVSSTDIFRRLGPLTVFSAHNLLSSPRDVILTNPGEDLGFNLIGDSPVIITNPSEQAKELGIRDNDVLLAVDDVDVKWCHHAFVIDLIASRRGKEIKLKLIAVLGGVKKTVTNSVSNDSGANSHPIKSVQVNNGIPNVKSHVTRRHSYTKNSANHSKKNSFSFLNSLKRRPKPDRFSTFSQTPQEPSISLQKNSTTPVESYAYSGATVLRKKKEITEYNTDL